MFCAILLNCGKHVLVNHSFEPLYVRMYDLVRPGALNRNYHCRMFHGDGTVRLVRDSEGRDRAPSNSR